MSLGFQLIRFNPIGGVNDESILGVIKNDSFQLIRFNPIGGDFPAFAESNTSCKMFPTNPI